MQRPGRDKTLREVIENTEDELSKNLTFTLEKDGKTLMLVHDKQKIALPASKLWREKIYKEAATGIPFVSDGKTSVRCVHFFRMEEEANQELNEKAKNIEPAKVPLPGSKTSMVPGVLVEIEKF